MRNLKVTSIFFALILFSINAVTAMDSATFFSTYAPIAQDEMRKNGIPASIKLAQAALESGFGKSELATKANNFFGIKCKSKDCTPTTYAYKDDDYVNGKLVKSTFMAFNSPKESFLMHSSFLRKYKRYASLFTLDLDDYEGWAKGLQKAGYATNTSYAKLIINTIKKYNLDKYDAQVLGKSNLIVKKKNKLDDFRNNTSGGTVIKENTIANTNTNHKINTATKPRVSNRPVVPQNNRIAQKRMTESELSKAMKQTTEVSNYIPEGYKAFYNDTTNKGATTTKTGNMKGGNNRTR